MKKVVLAALILTLVAASQAATLFKYSFDNTTSTTWDSGRYAAGTGETETNVTGSGTALGLVPHVSDVANPPQFANTSSITASNAPVQGGKALVVDATLKPDGATCDFNPAFGLTTGMTVEAAFLAKNLPPTGSKYGLGSIFTTEWPFGGNISWNIRTYGTQLQFIVSSNQTGATGGERAVNADIVAGRWYHIAGIVTYNATTPASSTTDMYLDGVKIGSNTIDLSSGMYAWGLGAGDAVYGNCFGLGYNLGAPTWGDDVRGLEGAIDAVAVSDQPLTPAGFVLKSYAPAAAQDWDLFE